VLHANCPVGEHRQRLAFDLGIAVGHVDGRLFVAASDELGALVPAVVDDGFVNSADNNSSGIAGNSLREPVMTRVPSDFVSGQPSV
jgi:hypothetical protein